MWDALAITEEEAAGLAELAQHDLAMARDFAERARAAEDPDTANELARSYQRCARSYRQTLALKARLARDLAAAERAAAAATPREDARIRRRVDDVREAVERVIWAEQEALETEDEADPLDPVLGNAAANRQLALLDERLALAARDNRFGLQPLDDHVLEVAADLGLDPSIAHRWRDLPDPDDPHLAPDAEPEWRGSG